MTENTEELAKKEFKVIRDLLLVPLKQDLSNEELPKRRKWKGGCLPVELPDLVPINPFPEEGLRGFCKLDNRNLTVIVKNQGNAKAAKSTTRMIFSDDETASVLERDIPEIQAGESYSFEVSGIQCFCQLIIIVNAKFEVVESDFTNNVAFGLCSPPALTQTPTSDRDMKEMGD